MANTLESKTKIYEVIETVEDGFDLQKGDFLVYHSLTLYVNTRTLLKYNEYSGLPHFTKYLKPIY